MSKLKVNSVENLVDGSPLIIPDLTVTDTLNSTNSAKAMVSFEAFADGSVIINASLNVSSVTYQNSPGIYLITYANTISGFAIPFMTGTVGLTNGGAAIPYLRSGSSTSALIGTVCAQSNGTLLEEGSNFYQFIAFSA